MPTYDYICTSCGNAWELEQRIVEDPIKDCPKCGQATAKRQISSGAGFILKGGGWYADLYASKPAAGKDGDSKAKSDTKDGDAKAKTDTKADAAPTKAETGKPDTGGGGGGGGSTPGPGSKGSSS